MLVLIIFCWPKAADSPDDADAKEKKHFRFSTFVTVAKPCKYLQEKSTGEYRPGILADAMKKFLSSAKDMGIKRQARPSGLLVIVWPFHT